MESTSLCARENAPEQRASKEMEHRNHSPENKRRHTMEDIFVNHSQHTKRRPNAHIIGESAVDLFKSIVPRSWVVRDYEPDYGIDLDIELFSERTKGTLGEHVLVQVKGVESANIRKLRIQNLPHVNLSNQKAEVGLETDVVQHQIETSLLATVEEMGSAVPVLLSVVDLAQHKAYLICLNDYIEKIILPTNPDYQRQASITINIPITNVLEADHGCEIIAWYGKRAKLYAFFNIVNNQLNELEHSVGTNEKINLAKRFAQTLGRLDVWSAAQFWAILTTYKEELVHFYLNGIPKYGLVLLEKAKEAGEDVSIPEYEGTWCGENVSLHDCYIVQGIHLLWEALNALSHTFEDILKECYLPTKLMLENNNA